MQGCRDLLKEPRNPADRVIGKELYARQVGKWVPYSMSALTTLAVLCQQTPKP